MKFTVEEFEAAAARLVHSTRTPAPIFRTRLRVTEALYVSPCTGGRYLLTVDELMCWAKDVWLAGHPTCGKRVKAAREALQRVGLQP